jgi:hypothetical protein
VSLTLMKYIPQALMHFNRKTTSGFSIEYAAFDMAGALLSLLQLYFISLHAAAEAGPGSNVQPVDAHHHGSVASNLPKVGLGVVTLVFDSIFMAQFMYYRHRDRDRQRAQEGSIKKDLMSPPQPPHVILDQFSGDNLEHMPPTSVTVAGRGDLLLRNRTNSLAAEPLLPMHSAADTNSFSQFQEKQQQAQWQQYQHKFPKYRFNAELAPMDSGS